MAGVCSSSSAATGGTGASGGSSVGTGGSTGGSGGTTATGGTDATGGSSVATGGSTSPTGGTGGNTSPTGGTSSSSGGATGGTVGNTGGDTATGGSTAATGGSSATSEVFDQCRFHFGAIDAFVRDDPQLAQQLDYFTPGWMGLSDSFDMGYVCDDAGPGGPMDGLVPAIVAYVIAFAGRRDEGLQDCNVSGRTNLCLYGATYIRNNRDRILQLYDVYARGFADCWGTTRPIIFLMEPDYYQYHAGGDANALSPQEAGQLMAEMVATMRAHLPNAVFSLDISPWIPDNGSDWYPNFTLSDFTFINTSGGGTDADSERIRAVNDMTWAGVHQVTGKPILADTGYGASGSSAGHDALWDIPSNINARIADGVVSINQYNPESGWANTISQIRPQLDTPTSCP